MSPERLIGIEAPFPSNIKPMRPTLLKTVPKNLEGWTSEIKWNGIRTLIYIEPKTQHIRIKTNNGYNATPHFPYLVEEFSKIQVESSVVLDGEIIAGNGKSKADRQLVTNQYLSNRTHPGFFFIAFDLLYAMGRDLTAEPLIRRKRVLDAFYQSANFTLGFAINYSKDHIQLLELVQKDGYEGVVFKNEQSRYNPGKRTRDWLKFITAENN